MSFWYNNGREPWTGIDTNSLWTIRELPTQLNRSYLMAFGFSESIAFKRLVDNCISDGLRFYHRQTIVKLLYAYGFYNIHLRQTLKCRWYRSANIAWDTEKKWFDKREFNQSADRKFHTWHDICHQVDHNAKSRFPQAFFQDTVSPKLQAGQKPTGGCVWVIKSCWRVEKIVHKDSGAFLLLNSGSCDYDPTTQYKHFYI